MKLGIISRRDAEWLGMSVAVAGGWVMVPEEWMNCSRLMDYVSGLSGDRLLAAMPDGIESVAVEPVDLLRVAAILHADLAYNERRAYCLGSRAYDVEMLRLWLGRIKSLDLAEQ